MVPKLLIIISADVTLQQNALPVPKVSITTIAAHAAAQYGLHFRGRVGVEQVRSTQLGAVIC